MASLHYLIGDATDPEGLGTKLIFHICNSVGAWGAGFVVPLGTRWPRAKQMYKEWYAGERPSSPPFALGEVQFVEVGKDIWVANAVAQEGIRSRDSGPPIRYEALRKALRTAAKWAEEHHATVHMPNLIGCGLAGGNRAVVTKIIEEELVDKGIEVMIYSLN